MTSKHREFWIDLSDSHDGNLPLAFPEYPRQGPIPWQAKLVHVIEYEAYADLEKKLAIAVNALSEIYYEGMRCCGSRQAILDYPSDTFALAMLALEQIKGGAE